MKSILFKASTRGFANHGWLKSYHTFSFADYQNPGRMGFGVLRVVNDDSVGGGHGFDEHPHKDMEIVSIPTYGALKHGDNMGNNGVIETGDIQIMSAGTGVVHSEYNANADTPVKFYQIWIIPNEQNVTPRYDQKSFDFAANQDELIEIISPDQTGDTLWLHQQAWFSMGHFAEEVASSYKLKGEGTGVFVMAIDGSFEVEGIRLDSRDAIGIWEKESVKFESLTENSKLLIIEVLMN